MKKFIASLSKKLKKITPTFLMQNKYVLYLLAAIAIINILTFANKKDYNSIIIFVIIGFLSSFFSKNMIVILLTAILFTYAFRYVLSSRETMENKKHKEGFEDEAEDSEKIDEDAIKDIVSDAENIANEESSATDASDDDQIKKKQETYEKLKSDFTEFQSIQENILKNMKEIDPLLTKAENFIEKFEQYKST